MAACFDDPNGTLHPKTNRPIQRTVETFFGGARGGGKTSGMLGRWIRHASRWGRRARGILFRKTYDELEEVQEQARQLYPQLGAKYNHGKRLWEFPNEANIRFRYMDRDADADNYQGRSYSFQVWEEIGNWATPNGIDKVSATLRSASGVECEWLATGNPGGVGHNWVKARFVDPAPPGKLFYDDTKNVYRVFIPSKLSDNRILMENDPGYADRLRGTGPDWLVKAWLDGLWDIVAGGMFDDVWRPAVHAIDPFKIPSTWTIYRSFDWGSSAPFSLGWWAIADGDPVVLPNGQKLFFHKDTRIRIAEWYGCQPNEDNTGLNMIDTQIAIRGLEIERELMHVHRVKIEAGPADPSIFNVVNGTSIAGAMANMGMDFIPAPTGPGSRVAGWAAMRRMMMASQKMPMEEPGMFVFNTCRSFIKTVPSLPRDKRKIEDVDSASEDHIGDETRYALTYARREVQMLKLMGA